MKLLKKLRALFRKETLDREMSEELLHHLDLQAEANLASGMKPDEARHAAQRQFGGVEQIKETARDQRGIPWLEHLLKDLRHAARQLLRAPGFAAITILTVALGIGACTALFSVVNGVLIKPLDFPRSRDIVFVSENVASKPSSTMGLTPGVYLDWARENTVFEHFAVIVKTARSQTAGLSKSWACASATPVTMRRPGRFSAGAEGGVRNALVILEISIALILLVSTGLLVRSLRAMQTFDQGLRTENVAGNKFTLNSQQRYNTPEKILNFTHAALERVQALPDVECTAITLGLPMDFGRGGVQQQDFILEGGHVPTSPTEARFTTDRYAVTPDYFKVLSIPVIRGRAFNSHDTATTPRVVLVNQEMVRVHFPDKDPVGQRIRLLDGGPETWSEIIGIVGDVKSRGPQSPTGPQVYQAFDQVPEQLMTIEVRAKGPAPGLAAAVRDIFHSLDKDIRFETLYPLEATISYAWIQQRFNMILFTLFSVIALILAAIGIYGVMAYSVNQRTHEIGVRMALGALPRDVLRLILASGARIIGIGLLLGTAGALASTRVLSSLLFNVSPYDPVSFVVIIVLLSAIALLACWIPARRATKVDPIVALRTE